ncbi:MAG: DUF1572 domain-containing protein [Chitinophagaceae bacterium]|nr:MAG: DUF1572 domain-containing protein [Chitinophagaceae bacterium]
METEFLRSARKQFEYYKSVGDKTMAQLSEKDLFWQFNHDSNSIAIIVNHLWGNMMSRWTDFLSQDGEKEWRNRDLEFEPVIQTKAELLARWNEGWQCLFNALDTVNKTNFGTVIYIRNQAHSVTDAINRQLAHYAYHVGQMVYIGKMVASESWQSLTIPKGKSVDFNETKFAKGRHEGHFSDDLK